jgi:hypothetical protein
VIAKTHYEHQTGSSLVVVTIRSSTAVKVWFPPTLPCSSSPSCYLVAVDGRPSARDHGPSQGGRHRSPVHHVSQGSKSCGGLSSSCVVGDHRSGRASYSGPPPLRVRQSRSSLPWSSGPVRSSLLGSLLLLSTRPSSASTISSRLPLRNLIGICLHYHRGRYVQHNTTAVRLQATARTDMTKRLLLVLLYE